VSIVTPEHRAVRSPEQLDRVRAAVAVGLVAALAAGIALPLSLTVFAHFSADHDEPVYVYQSEVLRRGDLTVSAATTDPFFRPWLYGERDGQLFSAFPPVWPALLAASETLTGTERAVLVLDAVAAVVLVYLFTFELLRQRAPAIVAAGLLSVSPFFLVLAGTRLSYPMALVLALGFGWSLLRAGRTGRPGWWMAAGVWWGILAFARPLDAMMFGSVAAVALMVIARRSPPGERARGRLGPLVRRVGLIGAGAIGPLAVGAIYNAAITGSPLRFPLAAAGGRNDLGFGPRQLTPTGPVIDFEPSDALRALLHNLYYLPRWSPGSFLIVALAGAGVWLLLRQGRRGPALLLLAAGAIVPIGNFPYWGNTFVLRGKQIIGPHYYLTILIPVLVLAAVALVALARRSPRAVGLLAVAMLCATGLEVRPKIDINRHFACVNREPLVQIDRALARDAGRGDAGPDGAIVFVPGSADGPALMHPYPALSNPPDLHARVLYANTLGPRSFELASRYPGRALYRMEMRVPASGDERRRVPVVHRIKPTTGPRVRIPFEAVNPGSASVVSVYLTDGTNRREIVLDRASTPGRHYRGTWVLGPDSLTAELDDGAVAAEVTDAGPGPWHTSFPATLVAGVAMAQPGGEADRAETHFWIDGGSDHVSVLLPGEAFRLKPSSDGPDRLLAEDVAPMWRVTGDAGGSDDPAQSAACA
jgi:hypothetical protein